MTSEPELSAEERNLRSGVTATLTIMVADLASAKPVERWPIYLAAVENLKAHFRWGAQARRSSPQPAAIDGASEADMACIAEVARIRSQPVQPGEEGEATAPYTETFNAIAEAVTGYAEKHVGISVIKFDAALRQRGYHVVPLAPPPAQPSGGDRAAREAFLDLIADALEWVEDDEEDGHLYTLRFGSSSLIPLMKALGLEQKHPTLWVDGEPGPGYESPADALERLISSGPTPSLADTPGSDKGERGEGAPEPWEAIGDAIAEAEAQHHYRGLDREADGLHSALVIVGKLRSAALSASPPPTPGRDPVGAAEREVGRYVYMLIEARMDAKAGTAEGRELAYLAAIVSDVEEYGAHELMTADDLKDPSPHFSIPSGDHEGLVEEARADLTPEAYEQMMVYWDHIRAALLVGCKGTEPRDSFETIIDGKNDLIRRLADALSRPAPVVDQGGLVEALAASLTEMVGEHRIGGMYRVEGAVLDRARKALLALSPAGRDQAAGGGES